jgi:hypothetical protein
MRRRKVRLIDEGKGGTGIQNSPLTPHTTKTHLCHESALLSKSFILAKI